MTGRKARSKTAPVAQGHFTSLEGHRALTANGALPCTPARPRPLPRAPQQQRTTRTTSHMDTSLLVVAHTAQGGHVTCLLHACNAATKYCRRTANLQERSFPGIG